MTLLLVMNLKFAWGIVTTIAISTDEYTHIIIGLNQMGQQGPSIGGM